MHLICTDMTVRDIDNALEAAKKAGNCASNHISYYYYALVSHTNSVKY